MQGWESIRAEVLNRIQTRIWPPGALIPSEQTLAQEFHCARATVNRALRDLALQGVLERKRKAGTRVVALPVRKATLDITVIRHDITARGQSYSFHVLSQSITTPPMMVAARLGLAANTKMIQLQTLHLADGKPYVYEDRWLNPAVLPTPAPDFTRQSANEWLVAEVAYTTGDIAFSAEPASPSEAAALNVPSNTPLFIIERCTWDAVQPITWVRLSHPPGYRLQTPL